MRRSPTTPPPSAPGSAGVAAPPPSFEHLELPGAARLIVRGPLTGEAVPALRRAAGQRGLPRCLLLDLSGATEVDRSGARGIAELHEELGRRGATLMVLPGAGPVGRRVARLLAEDVVIIDRTRWGAQPGGWLAMTELAAAPGGAAGQGRDRAMASRDGVPV